MPSLLQELDPLIWTRVGNIVHLGGSFKLIKSWNPRADDTFIKDLPFQFNGYQQANTTSTVGRENTLRAADGKNYIRVIGSGGISDWPVGTYIYMQSTWNVMPS